MRRALIVANKWWEADPLVATLSSAKTCPPSMLFIHDDEVTGLRGYFEGARGRIEVWCVEELMCATVSGSSSEEKARVLPSLLEDEDIALVLAFGTAATADRDSCNGIVRSGTNVFLHDAKLGGSSSAWPIPRPDVVVKSSLSPDAFGKIASPAVGQAVTLLGLTPPNNPARPELSANHDFVALADVNVTDYHKYKAADKSVVDAFEASGAAEPIGSLETTHGVIRECASDTLPFMFVSGITDRVGFFDEEVGTAPYQQNFVAAHNAGVAVAAMIPAIMAYLAPD